MSDSLDDRNIDFEEGTSESQVAEKPKGLGPNIAKILMFIGIGLGAVIFIVTIVVITVSIINKSGRPATNIVKTESYQTATPIYLYIGTIGEIRTATSDPSPYTIVVKLNLGIDTKDKTTPVEVNERLPQIRDMLRNYFSGLLAQDLTPDKESGIKEDIRERINRMMSKPSIKEVTIDRLDVIAQ